MSGILFDHIAIAVERLADAPAVLVDQLGGAFAYGGGRTRFYRFKQWRFAGGGRIEVLAPSGADGFLRRFLAERGPGIHHVTFRVPSLDEACERARRHGYDVVGYDDSDPNWKEAFLHPRQALGIVVQLAESAPGGGEEAGYGAAPDQLDPASTVTILGLRLRARSRERAHTQWGLILRGRESEDSSGEVVYRWPGSPLRLAVEIDPARDEGPVSIECRSARPLALPAGPHPVLGAVFIRRPSPRFPRRAP